MKRLENLEKFDKVILSSPDLNSECKAKFLASNKDNTKALFLLDAKLFPEVEEDLADLDFQDICNSEENWVYDDLIVVYYTTSINNKFETVTGYTIWLESKGWPTDVYVIRDDKDQGKLYGLKTGEKDLLWTPNKQEASTFDSNIAAEACRINNAAIEVVG